MVLICEMDVLNVIDRFVGMNSFGYSQLLTRFEKKSRGELKFLVPVAQIEDLFEEDTHQPENLSEYLWDPNDLYIQPQPDKKKKSKEESKQILLIGKPEQKKDNEEKKKNYKPGPFALFYELNEGTLNKDELVWFYKQHKQIVGPVSSYNMDKMVFYHQIEEQTRVAFKTVDKFVKFGKIKKIVEQEKKE